MRCEASSSTEREGENVMVRKRTFEDQAEEVARIHTEAVRLVKQIAKSQVQRLEPETRQALTALVALIANRERQDRCYYCGSTQELGTENATGLTQCFNCAEDAYAESMKATRRLQERFNDGYLL